MSLITPGAGEAFTVRIYKKLAANPALIWSNIYEIRTESGATFLSLQSAAGTLIEFERQMHFASVQFDRMVISTWIPDGVPYDPTSFYTEPLIAVGARSSESYQELSLNHVLFVRRATPWGQNGKLYYRRVLTEADVLATAGTIALESGSGIATVLATAAGDPDMVELFEGGGDWQLVMVATGQPVRPILSFQVGGVRIVQFNNRYFDVP